MTSWLPTWLGGRAAPLAPMPGARRRNLPQPIDPRLRRSAASWRSLESRADADDMSVSAPRLEGIRSWTCQLQGINWEQIEATIADVAVVDVGPEIGTSSRPASPLSPAHVARMRSRPGGFAETKVLAYLSIGEAEPGRWYWQPNWSRRPPSWQSAEGATWDGNTAVNYWDPRWQKILLDGPRSCLGRILATGFDGVCLGGVEAFAHWRARGRRDADIEMIDLVARIGATAWRIDPEFLIVPMNGEELLASAPYRHSISAIVKEDVLFSPDPRRAGVDALMETPPERLLTLLEDLERGQQAGLQVLALEYLADWPEDEQRAPEIAAKLRGLDFVPCFAPRRLDRACAPVLPQPAAPVRHA